MTNSNPTGATKERPHADLTFNVMSEADYREARDLALLKHEGAREVPYADSNGIASMGIGINLRVGDKESHQSYLAEIANDAQLNLSDDKLRASLEAIAKRKFPPTPIRDTENNAVQQAFDKEMAELHKKHPEIPEHFAYTSDAPLLGQVKTALADYAPLDHGGIGPVKSEAAAALKLDALKPAQRDELRTIADKDMDMAQTMMRLNFKMAEFHRDDSATPDAVPGSSIAKMQKMTDQIAASDYEKRVDNWLEGIPPSSERLALVSLAYNNMIGPGHHGGHKGEALREALIKGDREEAYAQIAFLSNGGKHPAFGQAVRRLDEADLIGHIPPPKGYGPDPLSLEQAGQMAGAYGKHKDAVSRNLERWGSDDTPRSDAYAERVAQYQSVVNAADNVIIREMDKTLTHPPKMDDALFSTLRRDFIPEPGASMQGPSNPFGLSSPSTPAGPSSSPVRAGRNG